MNERLGEPAGLLNVVLYEQLSPKGTLNDITDGSNGAYHATEGWDACTGWGSLNGIKLLGFLECNRASLAIRPTGNTCGGIEFEEGGTVRFHAWLKNIPYPVNITYQWSVTGAQGSTVLDPSSFLVKLTQFANPVTVFLQVAFDACTLNAKFILDPRPSIVNPRILHLLCEVLKYTHVNFFFNPLWDPLRDLVTHPLSLNDLREMNHLADELSHRTQSLLRESELQDGESLD